MDAWKTGALIAAARKEKHMTQRELAEKLGVTDRAVSRWERGVGFPDVSLLEPLAEQLSLGVAELIHGEQAATAEQLARETAQLSSAEVRRKTGKVVLICALLAVLLAAIFAVIVFWGQWFPPKVTTVRQAAMTAGEQRMASLAGGTAGKFTLTPAAKAQRLTLTLELWDETGLLRQDEIASGTLEDFDLRGEDNTLFVSAAPNFADGGCVSIDWCWALGGTAMQLVQPVGELAEQRGAGGVITKLLGEQQPYVLGENGAVLAAQMLLPASGGSAISCETLSEGVALEPGVTVSLLRLQIQ